MRPVNDHVVHKNGKPFAMYECQCGNVIERRVDHVQGGRTISCGCLIGKSNTRHGHSSGYRRTVEFTAYNNAKNRCTNPNVDRWPDYGGRGIEFRFVSFEEFLAEIGPKPEPHLSVDRIDVNGHYEIGNVRWADASMQALNKRRRKRA